jgi:hypothetical protein
MYNPQTHLDIARERHADLLREARKLELARQFSAGRPGLFARLRTRLAVRGVKQPLPGPA